MSAAKGLMFKKKQCVSAGFSVFLAGVIAIQPVAADEPSDVVAKWQTASATKFDVFMTNMNLAMHAIKANDERQHDLQYRHYMSDRARGSLNQDKLASYISSTSFSYLPKSDTFLATYGYVVLLSHPIMMSDLDEKGEQLRTELTNGMLREACLETGRRVVLSAAYAYPAGEVGLDEVERFAAAVCSKITVEVEWGVPAASDNVLDEITMPWRLRQKNVFRHHYLGTSSVDHHNWTPSAPQVMTLNFNKEEDYTQWWQERAVR